MEHTNYEVIIIGGSYAGLSAAMSLGRSLRKVLVIDNGEPCNRQTPHSHNFLTQDGATPREITMSAREQVLKYTTVTLLNDLATSGKRSGDVLEINTKSGETVTCKKLIFAAGIKDLLSAVDGLAECWGISVIHCPHCHGYEFKGAKTGIMANGERALHLASLVSNLTDQLTILTNGPADFAPDQLEKLKRHNINVSEEKVTKIDHINGHIKSVALERGTATAFDAVYASVPFVQHTNIAEALGCQLTEQGHISVDPFQKTNVSDIFACGDCASPMRSVANAVASGSIAGAMVNKELSDIDFA